jgi:hypothetical protein
VDRDAVAEPLELLADGQKVGLAPSDSGEAVRRQDDLHGRKSLRRTSTRTPGSADSLRSLGARALEAFRAADNPADREFVADLERIMERSRDELKQFRQPD